MKTLWWLVAFVPRWIPVAWKDDVRPGRLLEVSVHNQPYILYLDESQFPSTIRAMKGTCPHQGARFRAGTLDRATGCISCGYHGFTFRQGQMVAYEPRPSRLVPQIFKVPMLNVTHDKDLVYIRSHAKSDLDTVFQPPEEVDGAFARFSDSVVIDQEAVLVTENVLDMLHVSYVHTFGNRESPLPSNIRYTPLGPGSGRTTYTYKSGTTSLSAILGRATRVTVENEFHLPSTTVTRVTAGSLVKTVVTRACPVSPNETILFYTLYRNFWSNNVVETWIGTWILRLLMKLTLAEDIAILRHVVPPPNGGFLTPYDETIKRYREARRRDVSNVSEVES